MHFPSKKVFLFLAGSSLFICSAYAADSSKQPTILVVGSTRARGSHEPHFTKSIWKEQPILLSYEDKPHVITMDVNPAANPGKHIQTDAAATDPAKLPKINELYLERPWTFDFKTADISSCPLISYIKNLSPALSERGKVTVEWHPFIVRQQYYQPKAPFQENPRIDITRTMNPFTGCFDTDLTLLATMCAINKQFPKDEYSESFITEAQKSVPTINELLDFYASQQTEARVQLEKKLALETSIIKVIMQKNLTVFWIPAPTEKIESFSGYAVASFNKHVDSILITEQGKLTKIDLNSMKTTQSIDPSCRYIELQKVQFIVGTLYYFLWSDMTVKTNAPLAIKCLEEKLGLRDITLERGTSPHNGRKNVWLLQGFKQ